MSRILALDYGKKRTGVAVTDPLQIIATGLTTIDSPKLIWFLKDYFKKEAVEEILLGYPIHLDGRPNEITPKIQKLAEQLKKIFPELKITLWDERFTSKMASAAILQSGIGQKKRREKGLIDKISATILLQSYMVFKKGA